MSEINQHPKFTKIIYSPREGEMTYINMSNILYKNFYTTNILLIVRRLILPRVTIGQPIRSFYVAFTPLFTYVNILREKTSKSNTCILRTSRV